MRLKFPEPEIPEDGFSGIDIFGREKTADFILNLATGVEDNMTLALDAPWGSGKSFFLKQFKKKAEQQGFPCIVFDAFKNDITDSAFAAISGEIVSALNGTQTVLDDVKTGFKKAAAGAGKLLIKGALNAGVSYATVGIMSVDNIQKLMGEASGKNAAEAVAKGLGTMLNSASESAMSGLVDAHAESQKTISDLRDAVKIASEKMVEELAEEGEEKNPLKRTFFIIDELDRCRPDFAIDVLEVVKHFYDVENIVFIYSADFEKLNGAIKQRYGEGVDPQRYIEKFIDIWVQFSTRDIERDRAINCKYVEFLCRNLPTTEYTRNFSDLLKEHINTSSVSLREIQKIFQYFMLVANNTTDANPRPIPAVVALSFFKVLAPKVYFKLANGQINYLDLKFEFEQFGINLENDRFSLMDSFLRYCLSEDLENENDRVKVWSRTLISYHIDSRHIIEIVANNFMDQFKLLE